jgi:hypothetical protein
MRVIGQNLAHGLDGRIEETIPYGERVVVAFRPSEAHFPLDVIAGAGLGLFFGGVLNLVFAVPSASSSTVRASALRSVRVHGSPRPRGCGFAVNMRGPA